MKKIFIGLLLISLFTSITSELQGQKKLETQTITDLQTTPKYAFVLTTERHFKGVLSMYDLLIENGLKIEAYEIVVKGMVVKELTKDSELESLFEKYKGKVKVSVCSVAMEKLAVEAESLFDGLDITPTASVRMLQLQALGYNTLTY